MQGNSNEFLLELIVPGTFGRNITDVPDGVARKFIIK